MRSLLALTLLFSLNFRLMAALEPFYVATSGKDAGHGIYNGTLDSETGKFGPLALATKPLNAGFLAVSPDRKILVATVDRGIDSYLVEPGGKLTALNDTPSGGEGPCHVSFDAKGRAVFVANYGGGNIAAFAMAANGVIGNRFALAPFTGSGPDASRQKKPYGHSIYADPSDKFVYACDLGTDSIWIFKFHPLLLTLTPAEPPAAKVPPGSGPRHLTFSPDSRHVYVINEMGASVTTFARDPDSGALTPRETVPALEPGMATGHDTAAEIVLHPSGHYLYASVRGCDVIAVFSIGADGSLKLIQNVPAIAKFPRSFTVDPSGRWLMVVGQNDSHLAVLAIDPATGRVTATDHAVTVGGAPMCVLFAK